MISIFLAILTAIFTYVVTSLKIRTDYKYLREQKWLDKELEIVAQSWENLQICKNSTFISIADFKSYPDIKFLNDNELEELYKSIKLKPHEIRQLQESDKGKQKKLQDFMDRKELSQALKDFNNFVHEFNKTKIFLRPELKKAFENISAKLKDIVINKSVDLDYNTNNFYDDNKKKVKETTDMFNHLELSLEEIIFLRMIL